MTDPIGLAGQAGGAGPIRPNQPVGPGGGAGPAHGSGPESFKNVLLENLREVNRLQQEATTAVEDLQTGKRDDLEGVLLATEKADTAFRLMLSLRNKVHQAYEEVKQLRV